MAVISSGLNSTSVMVPMMREVFLASTSTMLFLWCAMVTGDMLPCVVMMVP